jgi:hypothetical protein
MERLARPSFGSKIIGNNRINIIYPYYIDRQYE